MRTYIESYFSVNLKDYPNINIDLPINAVIFAVTLGVCIAVIALHVQSSAYNLLIKQLLRHSALGESEAKSLSDLGLSESRAVRRALLSVGRLRGVVVQRGAKEYSYEEYVKLQRERALPKSDIDFDTAEFYIPKDRRDEAERIREKTTSTLTRTVFTCLFILAVFVCISLFMPELLDFINTALEK